MFAKVYSIIGLTIYTMMLSGTFLNFQRSNHLISLLNAMISYEKRDLLRHTHFNKAKNCCTVSKFLVTCIAYSVWLPVPYFFFNILNPCMINNVGFLLLAQCRETSFQVSSKIEYLN